MTTILHAGSLYKNYLVLYGENHTPTIIQIDDRDLQMAIYCNDVDFSVSTKVLGFADIKFNDREFSFPYWQSDNPMKFLGFGS